MNQLKVKTVLHLCHTDQTSNLIQWYSVWFEGPQLTIEALQSVLLVTNGYCRRPMCTWVDTSEVHLKKKWEGSMRTGFIWCRIQTNVRPLWNIMNFWVFTVNHSLRTAGLDPLWDTVIKLVRAFLISQNPTMHICCPFIRSITDYYKTQLQITNRAAGSSNPFCIFCCTECLHIKLWKWKWQFPKNRVNFRRWLIL